jgi:hypothetical protein
VANPSIIRIERLNYGIGAALAIASLLTQNQAIALGVVVGVALTCLNFFVLRRLIVKWTTDAAKGKTGHAPFLMLPKMVGMMGAVAAAVLLLPINIIAFTVGYSIFIVSIIVETVYSSIIVGTSEDAPNGNANGNE